jgi:hypothetical protein
MFATILSRWTESTPTALVLHLHRTGAYIQNRRHAPAFWTKSDCIINRSRSKYFERDYFIRSRRRKSLPILALLSLTISKAIPNASTESTEIALRS